MSGQIVLKTVAAKIELAKILNEYPDLPSHSVGDRDASLIILLKERFRGKAEQVDVKIEKPDVIIKWAIPKNPPHVENLNKQAIQLARKKDFAAAIESWRQALSESPNDPDYHYNLGLALYESKEYPRCVQQLQETIQICPPYYRAYFVLGNLFSKLRQFEQAAENLEKGLLFQHDNTSGLLNLAAVYSIRKEYNKAIPLFEKCISYSPKESKAYLGLGKVYAIEGDADNANRCFRAVIKIEPDGKLAGIAKKSLLAEEEIGPDYEGEIENVDLLFSEGYHAYIRGDFKSAVRLYKRYLSKKPRDVDVLAALASCQMRLGHKTEAVLSIEKATSLKSNKPALFKQAAMIYDICGQVKNAVQAAQKAFDMGKQDSITLTILGKNLAAVGNVEESLKYLAEAVKLNPNNINARFHFARLLSKMGQTDAARQQYEEVLWSKFDTPLKLKAQQEIEKLLK